MTLPVGLSDDLLNTSIFIRDGRRLTFRGGRRRHAVPDILAQVLPEGRHHLASRVVAGHVDLRMVRQRNNLFDLHPIFW